MILSREHYIYCCLPKKKKRSFALAASPHCNRTAQRRLTSNIGINHVIHHRTGQDRTGQDRTGQVTHHHNLHVMHTRCRRAPGAFEAKKSHQAKKKILKDAVSHNHFCCHHRIHHCPLAFTLVIVVSLVSMLVHHCPRAFTSVIVVSLISMVVHHTL